MISIIIPVYNVKEHIDQCLQSVLAQTYTDWECILVDDGSTDGSGDTCDGYAKIDTRFNVIHQDNLGVSSARNNGLKMAKGEFVCFIDSDDWVESSYLFNLYSQASETNISLICGGFIREWGHKSESIYPSKAYQFIIGKEQTDQFIEVFDYLYGPWCKLYTASVIKDNHITFPIDISLGEDLLFNLNFIDKSKNINIIPKADYHYRCNQNSLSTKIDEGTFDVEYKLWKARKEFLIKYEMWTDKAQEYLYKHLWGIIYKGTLEFPNPSLSHIVHTLSIPEIKELSLWKDTFSCKNWIKHAILNRASIVLYLINKIQSRK